MMNKYDEYIESALPTRWDPLGPAEYELHRDPLGI